MRPRRTSDGPGLHHGHARRDGRHRTLQARRVHARPGGRVRGQPGLLQGRARTSTGSCSSCSPTRRWRSPSSRAATSTSRSGRRPASSTASSAIETLNSISAPNPGIVRIVFATEKAPWEQRRRPPGVRLRDQQAGDRRPVLQGPRPGALQPPGLHGLRRHQPVRLRPGQGGRAAGRPAATPVSRSSCCTTRASRTRRRSCRSSSRTCRRPASTSSSCPPRARRHSSRSRTTARSGTASWPSAAARRCHRIAPSSTTATDARTCSRATPTRASSSCGLRSRADRCPKRAMTLYHELALILNTDLPHAPPVHARTS